MMGAVKVASCFSVWETMSLSRPSCNSKLMEL